MASSTPVTVTIWGVFQLTLVKVREGVERVPSVMSSLLKPMVTSAVGWLLRTTVKEAAGPRRINDKLSAYPSLYEPSVLDISKVTEAKRVPIGRVPFVSRNSKPVRLDLSPVATGPSLTDDRSELAELRKSTFRAALSP